MVVRWVEILTLTELQTCALPFPYQLLCWNYYNCNSHLPITLALNECLRISSIISGVPGMREMDVTRNDKWISTKFTCR